MNIIWEVTINCGIMTAEEFRPIWLKKIGYKDMIELELARISFDNWEDVPSEDDFAEAYAKQENEALQKQVDYEIKMRESAIKERLLTHQKNRKLQKQVEELKEYLDARGLLKEFYREQEIKH